MGSQFYPPSVGISRWSTQAVDPRERLDYWAGAICEVYLRAACTSASMAHFDGLIESVHYAGLNFTRMESSGIAMRTLASAPDGCKDVVYVVTHRHARWSLHQGARVHQLRPGDIALIDAREAYEVRFPEGMTICATEVPVAWLRARLRSFDVVGSRVILRDAGWGRVLSALCIELASDLAFVTQVGGVELSDQLGGLLAAGLEPLDGGGGERSERSLRERAEEMLMQRLGDCGLTAAEVATALGVSVRTLHRAFARAGTTFTATLRERRLDQAAAFLVRTDAAQLTVADIGARFGFQDASHFVRAFHRAWGMTPGRFRQKRLGLP